MVSRGRRFLTILAVWFILLGGILAALAWFGVIALLVIVLVLVVGTIVQQAWEASK